MDAIEIADSDVEVADEDPDQPDSAEINKAGLEHSTTTQAEDSEQERKERAEHEAHATTKQVGDMNSQL